MAQVSYNLKDKKVFWTESGKGFTQKQVHSLCDYYEKTGKLASNFTDADYENFVKKYIRTDFFEDELDPSGGHELDSYK